MDTARAFNEKIRDQYRSGILFHAVLDTQSGDVLFRHTKAEDTPPLRRLTPANFNETIATICYNLAKENNIDPERNYRAGTREHAFVNALQKNLSQFLFTGNSCQSIQANRGGAIGRTLLMSCNAAFLII